MNDSPYALLDVGLDRLCDAIIKGMTIEKAVILGGIALTTYYRYIDEINEITDNTERAQNFSPEKVEMLRNFAEKLNMAFALGEEKYVDLMELEIDRFEAPEASRRDFQNSYDFSTLFRRLRKRTGNSDAGPCVTNGRFDGQP